MKPTKQLAVALCVAACMTTSVFAEDDSGLVSATPAAPVITEPVNPQPGMIYSAYSSSVAPWMGYPKSSLIEDDMKKKTFESLKECHSTLPKMPALKTGVDKSDKFAIECARGVVPDGIRWEGFLKCKLSKKYTFLVQKNAYHGAYAAPWCSYAIRINGKFFLVSHGEDSFDANLNTGFNKVEIFCMFPPAFKEVAQAPLIISAKPKGSIIEPVKLSPGMLFYDARPELMESGL